MKNLRISLLVFLFTGLVFTAHFVTAQEVAAQETEGQKIVIGGKLHMTVPSDWERKQPRVRIIEHEFAVPPLGDDKVGARFTVMAAGGSVKANVDRWVGQFEQADGSATKPVIQKKKMQGQEISLVDLSGTFKDQRGPFAPAVKRADYRMLGAIIQMKEGNHFFLKLYGPKQTMEGNHQKFQKMVSTLVLK